MRFSTFTRRSWTRLSSRSTCRKIPLRPRSRVLYFASYASRWCGRDVAQRRVGGEVQPSNLRVDLVDRGKLPFEIDVRLHVDRLQSFRKAARLPVSVVLFEMTARAGDREAIQQCEVIEPQHVDEPGRRTLGLAQIEPAVELFLRTLRRAVDAGHAMVRQGGVFAFGGEGDLIAAGRPDDCSPASPTA